MRYEQKLLRLFSFSDIVFIASMKSFARFSYIFCLLCVFVFAVVAAYGLNPCVTAFLITIAAVFAVFAGFHVFLSPLYLCSWSCFC